MSNNLSSNVHDDIERRTVAQREHELAEAWDEVERLRGVVERLELEKFVLAEQLMRMGSDPS